MDLVGHYLLLAGDGGSQWMDAASTASERLGHLRLDASCVGRDIEDPEGAFRCPTRSAAASGSDASAARRAGHRPQSLLRAGGTGCSSNLGSRIGA